MHDIYEYLKKDFQKINDLFKRFEQNSDFTHQQEIFTLIKTELDMLAEAEQATFYKMLEEHSKTKAAAEIASEGYVKIQNKLNEIVNMPVTDKVWQKHVLELKSLVATYFENQEQNLFEVSRKNLSEEHAIKLKKLIHEYKENMR